MVSGQASEDMKSCFIGIAILLGYSTHRVANIHASDLSCMIKFLLDAGIIIPSVVTAVTVGFCAPLSVGAKMATSIFSAIGVSDVMGLITYPIQGFFAKRRVNKVALSEQEVTGVKANYGTNQPTAISLDEIHVAATART